MLTCATCGRQSAGTATPGCGFGSTGRVAPKTQARPKSSPKHRNIKNLAKSSRILSGEPFSTGLRVRKTPRTRAFSDNPIFSASETLERRGWDSNPRGTFIPAGFQDRCLQPLRHPSRIYRICRQMAGKGGAICDRAIIHCRYGRFSHGTLSRPLTLDLTLAVGLGHSTR